MRHTILSAVAVLLISGSAHAKPDRPVPADVSIASLSASFEQLARSTAKAVVQINVSGYAVTPDSSAASSLTRENGLGSGVAISEDGYIVTNAHVVRNAFSVRVKF